MLAITLVELVKNYKNYHIKWILPFFKTLKSTLLGLTIVAFSIKHYFYLDADRAYPNEALRNPACMGLVFQKIQKWDI